MRGVGGFVLVLDTGHSAPFSEIIHFLISWYALLRGYMKTFQQSYM